MSLDSSLVLVQPSPQMSCTEHLDSSAQPPSQPLPNSTASLDNEPLPDPSQFSLNPILPGPSILIRLLSDTSCPDVLTKTLP